MRNMEDNGTKKKITLLVPCYNEAEGLYLLYERICKVMASLKEYDFELLLINDGSRDNTLNCMKDLHEKDRRVSYLDLSRNFGKETAMIAGLDYVDADAVIILDADLQDPPELIPQMVAAWREGVIDVYARRRSRQGESFVKKVSSHLYYKILQRLTDIEIQVDTGDFRLLDRQAVEALRAMRERQRYTKGLFSWIGFPKREILFDRAPRAVGQSKWNYLKLVGLAIDGITSFSVVPLKLSSLLGLCMSFTAFIYMLFIIVRTMLYGDAVAGYPSLVSIILFIGGIELIVMGILGEYLGRIFNEVKQRPNYFVNEYNDQKIFVEGGKTNCNTH